MSLIETYEELTGNQGSLSDGRLDSNLRGKYAELLRIGKVFLPYIEGDSLLFAPSRYLGYSDNTISKHLVREERNGMLTNARIADVLRTEFGFRISNIEDEAAEVHFLRHCEDLGITASKKKRTYWLTPDVAEWLDVNSDEPLEATIISGDQSDYLDGGTIRETTRRAIVLARVGQGLFRRRVLATYKNCLVTGLSENALLVASHIKPWRDCRHNPDDCLNPDNALLLSPTWDALFDRGYVSFSPKGELLLSKRFTKKARRALGVEGMSVDLTKAQLSYMRDHRALHGFE